MFVFLDLHQFLLVGVKSILARHHDAQSLLLSVRQGDGSAGDLAIEVDIGEAGDSDVFELVHGVG